MVGGSSILEAIMSISGVGGMSSAMTALKMLQQASQAPDVRATSLNLNATSPGDAPAAIWSIGGPKTDMFAGYGSTTSRTEHGDALMQKVIERMDQIDHTEITVTIGAETFDLRDAADKLGDRNIGMIASYASQIAVTDEEFQAQVVAALETAAMNEKGSAFNKMAYQAYLEGELEFVPAEEFGIKKHITQNFAFSESGKWVSSGSIGFESADVGTATNEELMQTRVVKQEDGTFIDPETGRYAHFTQIGGRAMVAFFDRPAG